MPSSGPGLVLGRTQNAATPPVGNRAHIEGHTGFWSGVTYAQANPETAPPPDLSHAEGHTDYWKGVTFAADNPATSLPLGSLAKTQGHTHYWAGVTAARADLAGAPPLELGKLKGHTDFTDGVAHGRAQPRETPPDAKPVARTGAWTEYWQGADLAKAADAVTPYAGPSSAEAAGFADYREGVTLAHTDLASLTGAAPNGAAAAGFADYRAGVEACISGSPSDPTRPAYAVAWQACAAGMLAGADAAGPPPVRTDGGFRAGFAHAGGMSLAREGKAAPFGGAAETLAAAGHGSYLAGAAAARADLASAAPASPAAARGHADALEGVVHARAHARGVAPDPGAAARTQTSAEYWTGVDLGRAAAPTTPYAGTSAVEAAGYADYHDGVRHAIAQDPATPGVTTSGGAEGAGDWWRGEVHAAGNPVPPHGPLATTAACAAYDAGLDHARASTANLEGDAPAGRVEAAAFAAYAAGVDRAESAQPNDPANRALSVGWLDYRAGEGDVRGGQVAPQQTWSGYLRGFARTPPPKPKRTASADFEKPEAKAPKNASDH